MSTVEFSNEFDTLLDSFKVANNFGEQENLFALKFDEYEKSVFLTKSQNLVVREYFQSGEGFDGSNRKQADFGNLIRTQACLPSTVTQRIDDRSVIYIWPAKTSIPNTTDVLAVINEKFIDNNLEYIVVPLSYTEYDRLMSKPYRKPLKRQVWRLQNNKSLLSGNIVEVIPRVPVSAGAQYLLRYVRVPNPIVLEDLTGTDLTVDGIQTVTDCEVDEILHRDILMRAVDLAFTMNGYKSPFEKSKESK